MKIAVIGAHKVGKTTLAEELLEYLPGYTLNIEPYYALEESGYIFSEIPDVDDFIKQFECSLEQISRPGDNIIFDRSPIDILAYIHAIDEARNIKPLFETAQTIIAGIDLLVFVPIEDPDLISCQKSDLPKLRYRVNDILNDWIWDLDIKTVEVNGTLVNRRNQIIKEVVNMGAGTNPT
ncbi:ATP-binding protein [Chitinophaga sp. S165]|uniref:ATP/GTP-binding protein n=1 Tax=Chitinophaga sp. S165 TaxID=2135462 RepID=UPI000D70A367|nr:ATP-binding protein [Chitinophaga sp. S165]PWV56156.1 AAA domain-containing protein [Chitinophaga sp. S165]